MSAPDLDPDLRRFLDAEVDQPVRDVAAAQQRVWAAVQATVGATGDGPRQASTEPTDAGTSHATGADAATGTLVGSAGQVAAWVPWVTGVAGFVLGTGVGSWVAADPPAAPAAIEAEAPAPIPSNVEADVAPAAPPEPVPTPRPSPQPTHPVDAPEPSPPVGSTEPLLIDRARVALRQGDPREALVTLMGHARRFPEGTLAEERDRLIIEALAAEGRVDEARTRARAFAETYPRSLHLPALAPWLR